MEGVSKKRRRTDEKKKSSAEKSRKRHDVRHSNLNTSNNVVDNYEDVNNKGKSYEGEKSCRDQQSSFGVFDFPWLHESMISASLDWSFPGSFFSIVDNDSCTTTLTTTTSQIYEKTYGESHEVRWPVRGDERLEFEAFECIWSSILD